MPKRRQSGAAQTAQNGLLPRQETAALQLARGATLEQAAKESGAGVTTIKTWAAQPEFNRRVAELRSQMTGRVFGKIVDAVTDAVDTLREVCRGSDSEAMRVRRRGHPVARQQRHRGGRPQGPPRRPRAGGVMGRLHAIRRRLDRLERDRDQPAGLLTVTFDQLVARPGLLAEGATLDWDSLAQSAAPPRDPSTIVTPAERRLNEIADALPVPAAKNGFVSVPADAGPGAG